MAFDDDVKVVVPSIFNMISSSADHQESEEAYNTGSFELPNPAGKAGGACTSAFLQQQYENGNDQTWVETLQQMRSVLKGMGESGMRAIGQAKEEISLYSPLFFKDTTKLLPSPAVDAFTAILPCRLFHPVRDDVVRS